MSLEALPGKSDGLMARHLGQRPCTYHPPQWWDLGDEYNALAVELCENECPTKLFRECQQLPPPMGMVQAGVLYGDNRKPIPVACACGNCQRCKGVVADHHATIAARRAEGVSFKRIAAEIGFSEDATRVYWHRRGKLLEEAA